MTKLTANLSMLFTDLDLVDRFKAAKQTGFQAVEIQFPYSMPAEQIKQALSENQLKLVLFNIDADDLLQGGEGLAAVPEKQALFQQALLQCQTYAKILQPEAINVLPGRCFNHARTTEYLNTFHKNLALTLKTFAPMGIKTVFEAINTIDMPDFIINNSQHMLGIVNQFKHPLLLMQYDIYHMQMMNEPIIPFIKQYADKIGHIQFADVPGRGQPGTGLINFDHIFSAIEQSSYKGWLGAEYHSVGEQSQNFKWLKKIQPYPPTNINPKPAK